MEYMLHYLIFAGKIEGGIILVDMAGVSAMGAPVGALKQILTIMSNHYVNRIFKFYMIHLPASLGWVVSGAMKILSERQKQKVQAVKLAAELQSEFALHQLESDLGGTAPVHTTFFPFPLAPGPFEA